MLSVVLVVAVTWIVMFARFAVSVSLELLGSFVLFVCLVWLACWCFLVYCRFVCLRMCGCVCCLVCVCMLY